MTPIRTHVVAAVVLSLTVSALAVSVAVDFRPVSVGEEGETFGTDGIRFQLLRMSDRFGRRPPNAHWRAKRQVDLLKAARDARRVERQAAAPLSPDLFAGDVANTSAAASGTATGSAVSSKSWRWLGPGNIGGRIRTLAISPSNPDVIFAGSAGGGIWKTTTRGASWTPVDDFMAVLSVSSLVIDPASSSVMYAGTGEGFSNGDALMGAGIFKSSDGGTTWAQLPATATGTTFQAVNRVAMSRDGAVLLAATGSGLYRSTNAGSTFTQVNSASPVFDVDFSTADALHAVAGGQGKAWHSVDGGATWIASAGLPTAAGRVEVAYAKSQPGVVYASVDYSGGTLYRSVDGGATFTAASSGAALLGNQGWYDNALWVSPVDGNHVIVGGVDLHETHDGGATWQALSVPIHVDQHIVLSDPRYDGSSNRAVFFGTDGGVFRADDLATAATTGFRALNNNLGVTQFYSGTGNAASGAIVGGTQDNGTLLWQPSWGTTWSETLGSDGGYTAADAADSSYFYSETTYLSLYRSTNAGASFTYVAGGISDAGRTANFIAPFALDPNDGQRMFAGGASLWRSDSIKAATPSWKAIRGPVSGDDYLSAIAVAPGNSDVLWIGHSYGRVFKSANATASAPTFTYTAAPTDGMVTRIAIDPSDWNTVYVTTGGFGPSNVLKTTDGGVSWADATGSGTSGLPDAPVYDLKIDPVTPGTLYAATQVGVFASADGGAHWELPQDGPANVSVDELFWMGATLVAATHGRGMFAVDTNGAAAPAASIAPAGVDFGSESIGASTASRTITVTNTGSAPLAITSVVMSGGQSADFAWSGTDSCSGATLAAGASCTRSAAFKPTAAGTRATSLFVYSNAPASPQSISLSGVGLAASGSSVPAPWTSADIGAVGAAGGASYSNGTFAVTGAGADIWGTADAFRFAYQPLSGDGTIVARVATVQNVDSWTKAGVMIRASLSASSAHASMFVSPAKGLAFQYRATAGGTTTNVAAAGAAPKWVKITRAGSTFTASISADGTSWSTVGHATIAMPIAVYVGLAVTSHAAPRLASATFDHVAASATASAASLPSGWQTADVGAVHIAGSASQASAVFTVKGSGADVWGTADAFRYAYYQLPGDGSIVARVATVQNIDTWTKAGVMIRQSLEAGSIHASLFVTPAKGIAFQRRTSRAGITSDTSTSGAAPRWVRLTRAGQSVTAAVSADGTTWTTIGHDTVPFSGAVWAGLAVTSHDATQLASATFDHVAVKSVSTIASGWSHADIGVVGVAGVASSVNGVFTVEGGGADIWGTKDALQYAFKPLAGDGQLVARVTSVTPTHRWAKAGVMIRASSDPSSAQAIMLLSAAAGSAFQYRSAASDVTTSAPDAGTAATPAWMKIVRAGTRVTGYDSTDGITWRLVGSATIALPATAEIGLAVSSHDTAQLCTATFDNVR